MKFQRENGGIISIGDSVKSLFLSYRQMKTSDPESGGIPDLSQTVICNFEVAKGFQSYVIGIQCH